MSRFSVIALSQLKKMQVIETIDTDAIIAARMTEFKSLWAEYDPPSAAQYDVENLEFDPIVINQENNTTFEMMVRDRVNQAARAVTLAYGSGTDLDAIASRYPGGVPRLTGELDDRYRRRIWLSPSFLSPHGLQEAYIFWALTADSTLRDASAVTTRGTGIINVTIMAEGTNPIPTTAQLNAVKAYIEAEARKGLTDDVNVRPPKITNTNYAIRVWLLPGFEQDSVMTAIDEAVSDLLDEQSWLGYDHTRMAISAACKQAGVYNIAIDSPAKDVTVDEGGLVRVTNVAVTYAGRGE